MPIEREIRRILYVRTDRIGDVLMNLPAIRLLRQVYPKAGITLMLDESLKGLLNEHPDIDAIHYVSEKKFEKDLGYRLDQIKLIKNAGFDLGVAANPDKWLHAALFFGGVRVRVGYGRKWAFFLTHRQPKKESSQHEIEKNIDLVKLVSDQEWDGKIGLPADEASKKRIGARIQNELAGALKIVAVHPGTSDPRKRWPEEKFAKLCDRLHEDSGIKTVLIGGPEEKETSKKVSALTRSKTVDWTGELSLRELSALFGHSNVKLLVSSDSGPVHVAWIAGTPAVAMYAKNTSGSDPRRWGPKDRLSETIFKPMEDIGVEEVYGAAKKVLSR
jgi:ADP-heptose:LPS heptosyltransferase